MNFDTAKEAVPDGFTEERDLHIRLRKCSVDTRMPSGGKSRIWSWVLRSGRSHFSCAAPRRLAPRSL